MHTTATFKVESWDEDQVQEGLDGRKLTHAVVKQSIAGDATGTGLAHWLMAYRPDGTADYLGLQQVEAHIGDRSGTFVCSSRGTFDGATAEGTLEILAGSGTGDFDGMSGSATFSAPHGDAATVTLEYDLAPE
jgi:Protein of unknown function (DUF3224)